MNNQKIKEPAIKLTPQWPNTPAHAYPAIQEEKATKVAPYWKRTTRASQPLEPEYLTSIEADEPEPEEQPCSEGIVEEGLRSPKERKHRTF